MRFLMILKVPSLLFQVRFTESKNVFPLRNERTSHLGGFRKCIGKCMGFENMQIFILKNVKRANLSYLEDLGF